MPRQEVKSLHNFRHDDDSPAGGEVIAEGLKIVWQNGEDPNGTFVETVIEAAKQRLEFYQLSKLRCAENEGAISHLESALHLLDVRRQRLELEKAKV